MSFARVLLLGDTHLGFDDPERPRVVRRRRGPDFFARFEDALEPALRGDADLVVHGGDVFHRPRVRAALVQRAMAPLRRVADRGVPVFVVPGNHERARIPYPLLTRHPNIHVLHEPRTVVVTRNGVRIAVSGFPFRRVVDAAAFPRLVAATGGLDARADVRLLCMHQAVEGATVGAHDFTFRRGKDVVPGAAIPGGFAAVLSGHIHRAQALDCDLQGRPLAAPVLYAGSVERTAFAERGETKGYALLRAEGGPGGGRLVRRRFVPLAARPMHLVEIHVTGLRPTELAASLRRSFETLEREAVVRVITVGETPSGAERVLCAAGLRELAPATMNVDLAPPRREERRRAAHRSRPA